MDDDLTTVLKKIPELMREREEDLEKREKELKKMKAQLEEEHPNLGDAGDVLALNVGGAHVSVLRRTLTQVEGSMMASKFSGRWDDSIEKDEEGRFFIDQDIALFRPLLNYLRAIASQTQFTAPPSPPKFPEKELQEDFNRMVDYYGMTFGVFPVGMYSYDIYDSRTLIATHPNIEIISQEKETFWLLPEENTHARYVKSFEVTLGPHSIAQIGWAEYNQRLGTLKPVNGGYQGAGYAPYSVAFDSIRGGMVVNQQYTSIPGALVKEGTVIRCENNKGYSWWFDGEVKVVTTKSSPTAGAVQVNVHNFGLPVPCLTVKGSFHVTGIELEFC